MKFDKKLNVLVGAFALGIAVTFSSFASAKNTDKELWFPKLESSYTKQVLRYEVPDILELENGLNKNQVRHILGNPHFNEGMFFERVWHYNVALRNPQTNEYTICQLRVDYDKKKLVERLTWRGGDCNALLNPTPAPKPPKPEPKPEPEEAATPRADILFAFNRSGTSDIVGGSASVQQIAEQIIQQRAPRVEVNGYADPTGSDSINEPLSRARAATVANLLIQAGVPRQVLVVQGHGATDLYQATCQDSSKPQLIDCLQPNRRVIVFW